MAVLATAVLLGLAVAAAVHLLLGAWRRWLHFRALEKAIPGPAALPLLGNTFLAAGVTPDNMMTKIKHVLGDGNGIVRITLPGFCQLAVVVRDPDQLQELFRRKDMSAKASFFYDFIEPMHQGLISLNGDRWRAHRKAIQPAFRQSVLDSYVPVFAEEARRFVDGLQPGVEQDVSDKVLYMATATFFRTALAADLDADAESMLSDIKVFVQAVFGNMLLRAFQPWLWPRAMFALTAAGRQIQRLRDKIVAYCRRLMVTRRAVLGTARDAAADDGRKRTLLDILVDDNALPDEEALNELTMFLGAAIDTTSSALCWAIKTLSLRPDVQERLRQEAVAVLGDDTDGSVTACDLAKLEYTERVLKEILRLLPAVPQFARQIEGETNFCDYTLPASSLIVVDVMGVHRDPQHWPDPLRFDPDRFLPENSEGRHPYAYIPFSAGPRNCIGAKYAMMAMKTLLATLLRRYRIDPADDGLKRPGDFPMTLGVTSRMVGELRVEFAPRVAAVAAPAATAPRLT